MQVAVLGAGIVGTCTAYFLAAAGHEVVVLERYGNVAQETSFGHAGLVSPGLAGPMAAPGAPKRLMSWLSRPEAPVFVKSGMQPALWRWLRRWYQECELERFGQNKAHMQRLTRYSQQLLGRLREHYALQYEQSRGVLQLFRTRQDLQAAEIAMKVLADSGIAHRVVDPDAARELEPALSSATPLAGAVLFAEDESGNCALFARQMRSICEDLGVVFHFNRTVEQIVALDGRIGFRMNGDQFSADAMVVAGGADCLSLLRGLIPDVPVYPVKGFSVTAPIRNFDEAPRMAVWDDAYQVAISRLGMRVRISGTCELGRDDLGLSPGPLRTLVKCGDDWFPDASNYNNGNFWCGAAATLPEGVPLLGATRIPNLYINLAHGVQGWAMASGAGKLVADIVSGQETDIDVDGLTLVRYG